MKSAQRQTVKPAEKVKEIRIMPDRAGHYLRYTEI